MIVIPMGGSSSRFYAEGATRPKYELPVGGRTLFDLSVGSFARYFATERFLFVARRDLEASDFVRDACSRLGVARAVVVEVPAPTRGQAETVAAGLERAAVDAAEPITIFNIDTVRPGFAHPPDCPRWDGYLEVFQGDGTQWSFVEPLQPGSTEVRRTTEKLRISDLCSTGLYYFARAELFQSAFSRVAQDPAYLARWRELYVAPLYNLLITDGRRIHYRLIGRDEVVFAGTPGEYRALCAAL